MHFDTKLHFLFFSPFFGGGERGVCRISTLGEKVGVEEDLGPTKIVDFCVKWFPYDEEVTLSQQLSFERFLVLG